MFSNVLKGSQKYCNKLQLNVHQPQNLCIFIRFKYEKNETKPTHISKNGSNCNNSSNRLSKFRLFIGKSGDC